jgi:eukaryotic-like serine/threonine-protein kinase
MGIQDMTPERWQQVKRLLEAALERQGSERKAFFNEVCAGDPELRSEVESLLAYEEEVNSFLEVPAVALQAKDLQNPQQDQPEKFIGAYQVLKRIGHGGMGDVFLAVRADDQYRKRVAIKLLRYGMDSEQVIARFRYERQILASLDHPNIGRLFDGGTTKGGLPYFVMEYIEGQSIHTYCDANKLTTVERLQLFQKVCSAVHYAHQNLIVHRDIKPGNILVTSDGTPKLLDFGIAKLLNPELYAHSMQPITINLHPMTPDYASPEQVKGQAVTTVSDVYSLGVLLYELLTGHRPYRVQNFTPQEIERVVCHQEPEKPSTAVNRCEDIVTADGAAKTTLTPESVSKTREGQPDRLRRKLEGDLDNIVLMAMRKEPNRRYISVEQFSEDIRRHLQGRPVIARQDTFSYRAGKFIKRNRVSVTVAVAFFVLLIASAFAITIQSVRASRERDKAKQVSTFLVDLFKVSNPSESRGNTITAREILDKGAEKIDGELQDQPEAQAMMMQTIGEVYISLGLFDSAIPLLERALKIRQEIFGNEDLTVAQSLNNLGVAKYRKADYGEAESLLREALRIRRKLLGNEHRDVAEALNGLGLVLFDLDRNTEAESLYREGLAMQRKLLGSEHQDYAMGLNNLGLALYSQGEYAEAERMIKESLAIHRKVLGNEHNSVALNLSNIATTLQRQGKDTEAEEYFREAITINRKMLGDHHRELGAPLNGLAFVMINQGNFAEAEKLFREALAIFTNAVGEENPSVATVTDNLGFTLYSEGKYEEAGVMYRKALAMYRKVLGEENGSATRCMIKIAELHCDKGEYATAESLLNRVQQIHQKIYPQGHSDIAAPLLLLGRIAITGSKPQDAEKMVREALQIRKNTLPAGSYLIANAESALGECLAEQKRFEEAEPILVESFLYIKSKRAEKSKDVERARNRLFKLYQSWGKPDKAAQYSPSKTAK